MVLQRLNDYKWLIVTISEASSNVSYREKLIIIRNYLSGGLSLNSFWDTSIVCETTKGDLIVEIQILAVMTDGFELLAAPQTHSDFGLEKPLICAMHMKWNHTT